ncbi:ABC transporter ATP-binding protein [Alicyclobacillus acidocaldarius]|uniref:ABC transporter related n=2 Tax=Alicyclobacillus acidocaldarius subsp. acidocaldarius TaxID=1388 RepID=C8WUM9_ALIAD|nr:ATP-binding cassette domain-containing protein [Alicyclobacillus acidocaldarius]ACV59845.1 ABC transporter related [Alicyclobacillus acidocaldarius subsp. acidocaldarius DSM 446]CAB65650.2 putative ABC-transporter ATP-binding protein [Alicyclobacillus acidocaldarius]
MTIEFVGVEKIYPGGARSVRGVSFQIREGEMVGLLGPSGSGKTTILRLIAGLERPTKGDVWIGGKRVTDLPPQKRNVGLVFQNYALFQHMTVYDNVSFGLREKRVPKDEMDARVRELLRFMRLESYANRFPHELSGGQQQRVALARALAPRPQVLLFDEPFAAIDTQIRRELRTFVRQVHDEMGVTSVFVTHDQEEALEVADRVLVLHEGNVEQFGTPEEVYEKPGTLFVASFIGESNVWTRAVQNGRIEVAGAALPVDPAVSEGSEVAVVVRPKDVELQPASEREAHAQVVRSAFKGSYSACWIRTKDGEVWEVHVPSADRHRWSPGAWVHMNVTRWFIFPR